MYIYIYIYIYISSLNVVPAYKNIARQTCSVNYPRGQPPFRRHIIWHSIDGIHIRTAPRAGQLVGDRQVVRLRSRGIR